MASSTAPERLRIVGSSIISLPPALRTPSQPECCCSGRDDASFTAYATARPAVCFLRARSFGTASSGQRSGIWDQLQNHIRRQCERLPGLSHSLGESDAPQETNQGRIKEGEDGCSELLAAREQKRILILMSDTGGGHRASAEAIKTTFELEYGDEYQVTIIDLWKEHTPWPFNQVPRSYSFLVKHEALWKMTFHGTAPRFIHQSQMAATSAFVAREVAKGLMQYKPDVIVSVHPLMQHIPLRVLRARGLLHKIPFTTVITDLSTCHPTWFHKLVTTCFCPTKEVAQRALKAGLKNSQLRVYGLPIRPTFCKATKPKDELRVELGMDHDLPAVLLMGGGEGMGPVEATARALGKALYDARSGKPIGQLVVICGRNKRLVYQLQKLDWSMPVQVKGFVSNMSEWMGACDCVITKAGPGTIAEAMIRGLPMLLNDYIAGQEAGNVPFVVDNGAGKYCEKPKEIARTVADWFGPKAAELQEMARNAAKLARPDAVFKIVHDLAQLAQNRRTIDSHQQLALT